MSVWSWLWAGITRLQSLPAPTIVTWDLAALGRILPVEARSL